MAAIQIRKAAAADAAAMARLLVESADAQGARDSVCVDETILLREGFGASPRFHALIAEADGLIVGLAVYLFTFSTWTSVNGVHLEDLYVLPEWRRHGVAQALMVRLAEIAVAEGCRRLHWFVLKSNARARRFYESLGAGVADDWSIMQIDPKRLTT